ncbi:MAG: multidrug efflux SMR transporter [Motiliproteus sp.]
MKSWIFLSIAITAEVVATSALKASEGFTKPLPTLSVALGYAVAFYFLSLTLRTIPVGIAYAIWAGLGVVLITLVGWLQFDQKMDPAAIIGMGFIVTGVIIMNVFSTVVSH